MHRVDQCAHGTNGGAAFWAALGVVIESDAAGPAQLTIEVSREAPLGPPMVVHHRIILRSTGSRR
jgi:hypothetical protein